MIDTIPYDDGYGSDRGDAAVELLAQVNDMIDIDGPVVCEKVVCIHCGYCEVAIHAFAESIECGGCGLRNVSTVPRYPDLQNRTGNPFHLDGPL